MCASGREIGKSNLLRRSFFPLLQEAKVPRVEASVAFEPQNVPIRGRHNAEDVYVLRLCPKLERENPPPGATLEKPETYIVQRDCIANL